MTQRGLRTAASGRNKDSDGFTGRYALYRFFDAADALLYIGRTSDINRRGDQHARNQDWWPDVARCTVEFVTDFHALVNAETVAILSEKPRHNIVHNGVVVEPKHEAGWHSPVLTISQRVTAAADALHEVCRKRNQDYIGDAWRRPMTAPCATCLMAAVTALAAADASVGHEDADIAAAGAAITHEIWMRTRRVAAVSPGVGRSGLV